MGFYRAGTSQSCTANFQKLNLALLAVLISWAVLAMMCRHEKTQQAPRLEVVGPYGRYCLIRQLVVTRRHLGEVRYLRSDNFTLGMSFQDRFSQSGTPQAQQQGLKVWRLVDKMPRREVVPTKKCIFSISPPCNVPCLSQSESHRTCPPTSISARRRRRRSCQRPRAVQLPCTAGRDRTRAVPT